MTFIIFLILKFLTLLTITLYVNKLLIIHVICIFTDQIRLFTNIDIIVSTILVILSLIFILYLAVSIMVEDIEDIRDYPKDFLNELKLVFHSEMKALFIVYTYIVYLNSYIVSFYRYIKDLMISFYRYIKDLIIRK